MIADGTFISHPPLYDLHPLFYCMWQNRSFSSIFPSRMRQCMDRHDCHEYDVCVSKVGYACNKYPLCAYACCIMLSPPMNPCSVQESYLGAVLGFPPPSWEICAAVARMYNHVPRYFQTRAGWLAGHYSLGEQSQTRPRRSIRPDMLVLVLMPSLNYRRAFRNDNSSTQAAKDDEEDLGTKRWPRKLHLLAVKRFQWHFASRGAEMVTSHEGWSKWSGVE